MALPALALALLIAGAGTGCAARRGQTDRVTFQGSSAAERLTAEPSLAGRRGYASFAQHTRLRDDTPMLTPILDASRAADAPAPSYGPRGSTGERPSGVTWADPYPVGTAGYSGYGYGGYGYGGYGTGYGYGAPYVGPGGWVFPGMRPPPAPEVTSPYAAPFQAPAASDVSRHRPGLSTGTGVHGRDAR